MSKKLVVNDVSMDSPQMNRAEVRDFANELAKRVRKQLDEPIFSKFSKKSKRLAVAQARKTASKAFDKE